MIDITFKKPCDSSKLEGNKHENNMEIDIGLEESPKIVQIGKDCCAKERRQIEALIKEYKDIFVWSYDDLKVYKGPIINHTISLKEGAQLFR